ncbi:hypothetical protein FJ364_03225 [Candidatus Dependentiae bacterium]|nr:hypothetical protein [Candidatus Dependentiae bacterium]
MKISHIILLSLLIPAIPLCADTEKSAEQKPELSSKAIVNSIFNGNLFKYAAMTVNFYKTGFSFDKKYNGNPYLTCINCNRMLSYSEFSGGIIALALENSLTGSDKFEQINFLFDSFIKLLQKEDLGAIATFMLESFKNEELISYPCPDCKKNNSWIYDSNNEYQNNSENG